MSRRRGLFFKTGAEAYHHQNAPFMRTVAAVNTAGSALLLLVGIVYFFPPPIVCFAVMLLSFAGSLVGKAPA